jgi:hypothetical protein
VATQLREGLAGHPGVAYQRVDIQLLKKADGSYDSKVGVLCESFWRDAKCNL